MNKNFIINDDRVEIPSSKVKLFLLLIGSILFVIGGYFFVHSPAEFQGNSYRHRPEWEILAIGYACIIFFGSCVIGMFIQLFNSKPSLIIDDSGITIPGLLFTAFVSWDMIKGFDIINISRTKLVGIYLKKPNDYINTISNSTARKLAQFSLNSSGTPLSISAGSLKCNTNELITFLQEKLKESEIK